MRILTTGLAAAALLLGTSALTTPAFAGEQDHTCQGGHNCNDGGEGEGGGQGGTGIGVGIGIGKGGDATNTNNIDNKDFNANLNVNKNDLTNKNYNQDVNNNKNIQGQAQSLENKNYNTNKQGQDQDQKQGQLQGQAQAVENVGNVHIENERPPVNTAYSAALATSEDTCMGSSSIGGQAVSFGLTIGTTWTDDNCQRLKNSRQLVALGYHRAATALMCFDASVKDAMIMAGTPCPSGAAAVYVAPAATYVPPPRAYVPMAPVYDEPVRRHRRHKKALPPK